MIQINRDNKPCGRLEWLPTWEGVLKYAPQDLAADRPLRLWHVIQNRRFRGGRTVCFELKPKATRPGYKAHERDWLQPRGVFEFRFRGRQIRLRRSQVTMLALMGFAIADCRHWVVDHVNGITLDDRPSNLQVITQRENTLRSERSREMSRLPPAERKRRAAIRRAWAMERRKLLIGTMPEASRMDIELELLLQLRDHDFTEEYRQKGGYDVEES